MKKLSFFLAFITIIFLNNSCQGPAGPVGPAGQNGNEDKQIRIPIHFNVQSPYIHGFSDSIFIDYINRIEDFNINYYPGVDSAVLRIFAINDSGGALIYDSIGSFSVELYDITDSITIQNSKIIPYKSYIYYGSDNFFNSLPKKEIDLCLKLTVLGKCNYTCQVYDAVLYLYRK